MTHRLRKASDGRLSRLEAAAKTVPTPDTSDARLAHEVWSLALTGAIRVNSAGQWAIPYLFGEPASHVPQELVDAFNRPGAMRELAAALAASPDGRYALTDDEGRTFEHDLIPA